MSISAIATAEEQPGLNTNASQEGAASAPKASETAPKGKLGTLDVSKLDFENIGDWQQYIQQQERSALASVKKGEQGIEMFCRALVIELVISVVLYALVSKLIAVLMIIPIGLTLVGLAYSATNASRYRTQSDQLFNFRAALNRTEMHALFRQSLEIAGNSYGKFFTMNHVDSLMRRMHIPAVRA